MGMAATFTCAMKLWAVAVTGSGNALLDLTTLGNIFGVGPMAIQTILWSCATEPRSCGRCKKCLSEHVLATNNGLWSYMSARNMNLLQTFSDFFSAFVVYFFLWSANLKINYLRFWLQSDNTVKECRNTYAARILSALTQSNLWVTSSQNFLGVGHTHEDVDGVLALCKAAMDSASCIHTPQDVVNRLQQKLAPVFEKRGVDLEVEIVGTATRFSQTNVDTKNKLRLHLLNLQTVYSMFWEHMETIGYEVREWTEIAPDAVTFKNAYRIRKLDDDDPQAEQTPVPHSFIFTKRSGHFPLLSVNFWSLLHLFPANCVLVFPFFWSA